MYLKDCIYALGLNCNYCSWHGTGWTNCDSCKDFEKQRRLMYVVLCQNGRVKIRRIKTKLDSDVKKTLAEAKSLALAYVRMYKQRSKDDVSYARFAIRELTLDEFDDDGEWESPDF